MILRRHRARLEEFVRPEAGAPNYKDGKMGAAVNEPGGPSGQHSGQSGDGEVKQFDPAAHNIDQVLDYLGVSEGHDPVTAEEFDRVLQAERDRGEKARSTLVKQLEEYATAAQQDGEPFNPSEHEVDEVLEYLTNIPDEDPEAHDAEVVRVVEAERAGQNRPEVIEAVEGTPDEGEDGDPAA